MASKLLIQKSAGLVFRKGIIEMQLGRRIQMIEEQKFFLIMRIKAAFLLNLVAG